MHANQQNRALGLGIMGFTDVIEKLGYSYDSEQAYELIGQLTEFISFHAIDTSADLAEARGSYPNFQGSGWSKGLLPIDTLATAEASRQIPINIARPQQLDWEQLRAKVTRGMRNATLMAIAPTANIAHVVGTTPGLDPQFSQIFSRAPLNRKFLEAIKRRNVALAKGKRVSRLYRGFSSAIQRALSVQEGVSLCLTRVLTGPAVANAPVYDVKLLSPLHRPIQF